MIHLSVQAQVVDITHYRPKAEDSFFVDTNVWYWMTYARSSLVSNPPRNYQTSSYPGFLSSALAINATLFHCGLSFAELAHRIEATEKEIFNITCTTKEYRHNYPAEREKVVQQLQAVWGQVQSMAACIDLHLDKTITDAAATRFETQSVDGYDLFLLEAMAASKVFRIITDDGDYATVPGIQVFTANRTLISAASSQGKLLP